MISARLRWPNSPSLDTIGAMARSVEDLALIRSVLLEEPLQVLKPPAARDLALGLFRSRSGSARKATPGASWKR